MFGTLRNPCIYNRVIFRTLASLEPEASLKAFQICKMFFFYLGFLSRTFSNHRTAGEGRGHFFNSLPQLPPTSQTLRHQPGDCCRELTSAHSQQPDSNREPLVFECKSLTTKLRALVTKMFMHSQSPGIVRTVCSRLSRIFRHIQGY